VSDIDKLAALFNSAGLSQAAYVAAELRVADLLCAEPRNAADLARQTGAHCASLQRLMRALVSLGLCSEVSTGSFALTPMGRLLCSDAPDSLRAWALLWGRYQWPLWTHLLQSVKTGLSARGEGFSHLEADAETAAVFHGAMACLTRPVARALVQVYDFSGVRTLVDVGGGCGELLAVVLEAHAHLRGKLFDLAHATRAAGAYLVAAGVAERCEIVTGDFFESVPSGGDAYVLKHVIHDWDDEHSARVLRNCRLAMGDGAKLLLVEQLMPPRMEASAAHQDMARRDLSMLLGPGGRERTESEFRALLHAAGLRLQRIIPAALNFSIIEAVSGV
jgi:orsellinic acid C2-O-methyltransferase